MFVITGASGHVGSVAAEALLAAGKKVRVVVRNAAKAEGLKARGAEVFVADITDAGAFARAIHGAEGVFLLSPPDFSAKNFVADRKRQTQQQVDALVAEKVAHVVLLSSTGSQSASGTGPIVTTHNAEQQLRASGLAATFVRAGYFIENWGAVVPVVLEDGILPTFIAADRRIAAVSTPDIGLAVAQALLDGPRGIRIIELAGPEDVSANDVAAAFGRLLGKPVRAVEAPLDAVVPTLTSFGASQHMAGLMRELYEGLASGKVVAEPGEHQRGKTPLETSLRALLG